MTKFENQIPSQFLHPKKYDIQNKPWNKNGNDKKFQRRIQETLEAYSKTSQRSN